MALNKTESVKEWRYDFILQIFGLFLGIKVRFNLLQLARFEKYTEQPNRGQMGSKLI